MPRFRLALTAATILAATACAPARANTYAAVEQHPADQSRTDTDIAVLDATTGASVAIPDGVNTGQDEVHPTISANGKKLVFERRNPATGGVRILLTHLPTGKTRDLFNAFDAATDEPSDPAITPDGAFVATGGPFVKSGADAFQGMLSTTPVGASPPTHSQRGVVAKSAGTGTLGAVAAGGAAPLAEGGQGLFAFQVHQFGHPGEIFLDYGVGLAAGPVNATGTNYDHPALAATDPQFVLFDARRVSGGNSLGPGDIEFRPVSDFQGPPTPLTGLNTSADESEPALTPDGRFVAFIRHDDGFDRLFLWDTETQEFLNGAGIALGKIDSRDRDGDVSLYVKSTFSGPVHVTATSVAAHIDHGSGLGILVQRIVGKHKVLGRTAFKLRKVGKVPLGHFTKGRHRIHWKLRIGGRRLKPGRYLLTLRALNRHKVITDLAKPTVVRIRARHRPKKHY